MNQGAWSVTDLRPGFRMDAGPCFSNLSGFLNFPPFAILPVVIIVHTPLLPLFSGQRLWGDTAKCPIL